MKYKYIFVVLVYKNIDVLKDFFETLRIDDYKVIVVNSYYDDDSLQLCREVSSHYYADFIPIENKGYGYGNNVGTRYAMEHYEFDFLILSNSDIQINDISFLANMDADAMVIAPHIHLLNGKLQNPNIPWYNSWSIPLEYFPYKINSRRMLALPYAISRLSREIFFLYRKIVKRNSYKIYSCHGAFIIFTQSAVEKLYPFFNDEMFLYNEELFLAEKCRLVGVPVYYCPKIDVLHLEGASSSKDKTIGFKHNKQSFMVFYDWLRANKKGMQ